MSDREAPFPYAEFLDELEEAIYWHIAWYLRGMRHLMLNDGVGEEFIGKDAHLHCRLGSFLGRFPAPPGCAQMVEQINTLHEQMHALMRDALLEKREGGFVGTEAYAEIEEMQSVFFGSLHGLLRKAMEARCQELVRGHSCAQSAR